VVGPLVDCFPLSRDVHGPPASQAGQRPAGRFRSDPCRDPDVGSQALRCSHCGILGRVDLIEFRYSPETIPDRPMYPASRRTRPERALSVSLRWPTTPQGVDLRAHACSGDVRISGGWRDRRPPCLVAASAGGVAGSPLGMSGSGYFAFASIRLARPAETRSSTRANSTSPTNDAFTRALEVTEPRRRSLLTAHHRRRNLEIAGRYQEIARGHDGGAPVPLSGARNGREVGGTGAGQGCVFIQLAEPEEVLELLEEAGG
jgi:hypothetical protein